MINKITMRIKGFIKQNPLQLAGGKAIYFA